MGHSPANKPSALAETLSNLGYAIAISPIVRLSFGQKFSKTQLLYSTFLSNGLRILLPNIHSKRLFHRNLKL